jgi:flavin reductase (DIM6/NTAB) family NADH-FMN oxidoreductase RutF
MRDPQEEIRVLLRGLGPTRDVTHRNVVAAARPHTIGIGFEGEAPSVGASGTLAVLSFEEREGRKQLLGEIDLRWSDSIELTGGRLLLFHSGSCRNYCLPRNLLWRQYLRWSVHRRRTRNNSTSSDHQLSTREVHAMFAFYICPRPVFLVSVADQGRSNIVPMDLLGTIGAQRFTLALKHASMAEPLLRRSRRAALSSVPIEQTKLVYRFGPNHHAPDFDWAGAAFGVRKSSAFGLPVPDFALRTRDLEVEEVRDLGSHQLFISRIVADHQWTEGDEFFESHAFYETWRQRMGRPRS